MVHIKRSFKKLAEEGGRGVRKDGRRREREIETCAGERRRGEIRSLETGNESRVVGMVVFDRGKMQTLPSHMFGVV